VVQDFLLPTVAYIGGPSEISYFAQSEVLYRNLLGRMPVMLPRRVHRGGHQAQRLLKQYGLRWKMFGLDRRAAQALEQASLPENISNLLSDNVAKSGCACSSGRKRCRSWILH